MHPRGSKLVEDVLKIKKRCSLSVYVAVHGAGDSYSEQFGLRDFTESEQTLPVACKRAVCVRHQASACCCTFVLLYLPLSTGWTPMINDQTYEFRCP